MIVCRIYNAINVISFKDVLGNQSEENLNCSWERDKHVEFTIGQIANATSVVCLWWDIIAKLLKYKTNNSKSK